MSGILSYFIHFWSMRLAPLPMDVPQYSSASFKVVFGIRNDDVSLCLSVTMDSLSRFRWEDSAGGGTSQRRGGDFEVGSAVKILYLLGAQEHSLSR
jgi:hypothetical protein